MSSAVTAPPLRDYQQDAHDAILSALDEHESTLLVLPTGCHVAGQPILMFDGSVRAVEDVAVGDLLMGPDSAPRLVSALARGRDEIVEIVPVKGDPWRVNRDHVLTLVRTNETASPRYPSQARSGEIIDVTVREWMSWPRWRKHIHKLLRVAVEFRPAPPLALEPYFLGVVLGDGCLTHRTVEVCKPDVEIRDAVAEQAEQHGLRMVVGGGSGHAPTYRLSGRPNVRNPVAAKLAALGLMGCDSRGKFIPAAYMRASRADRLALLAGLLDTDGHLTCNAYDWISASRRLADDTAFVARSLGLAAYVSPCEKYSQDGVGGTYYRVSVSGDVHEIPCRIPRKRAAQRQQKKSVLRTGFDIVETGEVADYFGFSLSGDGRFLLGDFTVTHNTGKTRTFSEVAATWRQQDRGAVLCLAHRGEIVEQNARALEAAGLAVSVEMGEERAARHGTLFGAGDAVSGSVQSLARRLKHYSPDAFTLLIFDEAHHAVRGSQYDQVREHFDGARILGVTATPDRLDKRGMAETFKSVAFTYEIQEAIKAGHLVPLRQRRVTVDGLDFSRVRTLAGDLNERDLDAVMREDSALHGIAEPAARLTAGRPSLVFAVTVEHAHALAAVLCMYAGDGQAQALDGTTAPEVRRRTLGAFRAGEFRFLVNCALFTEGTDLPFVSAAVMARPTKSRALYQQMVGRILRTCAGKLDALVLDFAGNAGKHALVSAPMILGADVTAQMADRIARRAESEGVGVQEALEGLVESDRLAELKRRAVQVRARVRVKDIDPFAVVGLARHGGRTSLPATEPQVQAIMRFGVKEGEARMLDRRSAGELIGALVNNRREGRATFKQARFLMSRGLRSDLSFAEARSVMDAIAANNWQVPALILAEYAVPMPGEDGAAS